MNENVISLAHNNKDRIEADRIAANALVVAFLREQADALEKGNDRAALKAILILYGEREENERIFSTSTRRCNIHMLEQVGLMHIALFDVTMNGTEEG